MDFDTSAASNSAQVAIYTMENQRAGRPAVAAPPDSASQTTSVSTRVLQRSTTGQISYPTTYRDLPAEILQEVAGHMPFDEVGNLSTVSRQSYYALQERRLSWLCYQRAKHAKALDLASMQQLLAEIERIRAEPALRAEPLQALWPRILGLPDEQRQTAFQRVFEAASHVPKQGLQIQKDMIKSISEFPDGQQIDLYNFAYADAERRSPKQGSTWAAVASLMAQLPDDQFPFASTYQTFISRLPELNAAEQAELIVELAFQLQYGILGASHVNAVTTIAEYYQILQEWVRRLPKSYQGEPIGALANSMWALNAQRFEHYVELRDLALLLPNHQLGSALRHLPVALATLPWEHHAYELSLLEDAARRVIPEQRIPVAAGLLRAAPGVDVALLKQVWQIALHLLDGGNETDILDVFHELEKPDSILALEENPRIILYLPNHAKTEIKDFIERNRISQAICDELFTYLAQRTYS